MFSRLSDKLQSVFKDLRGHGRISESNVDAALREVRLALLEADVHFKVAKEFIARVKEKALGDEVLRSVTPGQQIVKIFHDELSALLGGDAAPLNLGPQARILVVGLNGAGKTTTCAKLAAWLKKNGRTPVLIACDLQRPAAVEQLATLAGQIGVPMYRPPAGEKNVLRVVRDGMVWAKDQGHNVEIYDTAGRQDLDHDLIDELRKVKDLVQPNESLLVCDAATGQQAVGVAEKFHGAVGVTGLILTKLDGDARGGAALSLREVTGQPVKFAGTGEKVDAFEVFHPDRMAGRILGMGDVISLVEKAAANFEVEDATRMEARLKGGQFDLNDFLEQFKMLRKMGPLENLLGLIPGMDKMKSPGVDDKQMRRVEAIVLSMTLGERSRPDVLNARRRQRIARGSGTTVTEVNNLLLRFSDMRKLMKKPGKLKKMMARAGGMGMLGRN
ncbi:MAG: signal recognition particle protein [Chthoniobacterales bacterium]